MFTPYGDFLGRGRTFAQSYQSRKCEVDLEVRKGSAVFYLFSLVEGNLPQNWCFFLFMTLIDDS